MNIAVFCASSENLEEVYYNAAKNLGKEMAVRSWKLLYGGTNCGLMRSVAEAVIQYRGYATGVIPACIYEKGIAADYLSELIVTEDMKERKQRLRDLADAFIALPGGWGTLEEISEVITLKQLGEHTKPIVFINIHGFYDSFFIFIREAICKGFVSPVYERMFVIVDTIEEALNYIGDYKARKIVSKYEEKNIKNN